MEFSLTPEQEALRDAAREYAQRSYQPMAHEWDREATLLPQEHRLRLAEVGYLGMTLPEKYGGAGAPLIDSLNVLEELAKECIPAAFCVFEAIVGASRVIEMFGSEEQRLRWLPPIIEGKVTMAVAVSEPDAGSAATDLRTMGLLKDGKLILNGTKRWCSGAGHAELYLVYCRLSDAPGSRGIGAVVVEKDAKGLTFGNRQFHMGLRGVASADMYFDNCQLDPANIVLPAGRFSDLFKAFSLERLGNATMSLAIAAACLAHSKRYVMERKQFGRKIADFQAVQMTLADMIMRTEATRLLVWRAASNAGKGLPNVFEASIAKCYANETAKFVADAALRLFAGYGYSIEYPIERHLRDSFGWEIAGGTGNMQRIRIVSEFLDRHFDQRSC